MKAYSPILIIVITVTLLLSVTDNANGQGIPAPVACWAMDETSGVRADSVGVNELAMLGPDDFATGKHGNAAQLTESSTLYNQFPGSQTSPSFTWAMWIAPDRVPRRYVEFLVRPGHTVDLRRGWARFAIGGQYVELRMGRSNEWRLLIVAYDDVSGIGHIWINDNHNQTVMSNPPTPSISLPLYVGNYAYEGAVDELAYFDYAVTNEQAALLYNGGTGMSCADMTASPTPPPSTGITVTVNITTPYDIDIITLPSGKTAVIEYRISSGDVGVITLLSLQMTMLIYWIIRDHVQRVGVKNDANK